MKKTSGKVLVVSAVLMVLGGMQQAVAADTGKAYLQEGRGGVVRSGYGLCWRTGYWKSADAIPECEGGAKASAPAKSTPVLQSISFESDALFDFNKFTLKPAAKEKLDALAEHVKKINADSVTIIGHTDSIGAEDYNQRLSVRRAESVRAYLIEKGVDSNKTFAKGVGEKEPVASNTTKEGRAKNRRVTIEVLGAEK